MAWTLEMVEAQSSPSSARPRARVVIPMHNEAPASAHVVRHPTNLGQEGAALETGMRYALDRLDVDFVVTRRCQ